MRTLQITDPSAISAALAVLQAGGLVICPTETVYGVLADCENAAAISKLLTYKRRPAGKAVSIAVSSQEIASRYVTINDQAHRLYQTLLPGAVTVVSASTHQADTRLESEFGTLGIRIPDYPFLLDLLAKFGHGVTATSANSAGRKTPYTINDIMTHLSSKQKNLIDLVIDAGSLPPNPPSLVIDTTPSTPIVMRPSDKFQQFSSFDRQKLISHDAAETQGLAGKLILPFLPLISSSGLLITLDGDLGAGKTTFTQGLAAFLGINETVNSPTYTYLKQYPFTKFDQKGELCHLDAWTIDRPELLQALQIDTLFTPHHLVIIEWWPQIAAFCSCQLPRLDVAIHHGQKETERTLIVTDMTKNIDKKE